MKPCLFPSNLFIYLIVTFHQPCNNIWSSGMFCSFSYRILIYNCTGILEIKLCFYDVRKENFYLFVNKLVPNFRGDSIIFELCQSKYIQNFPDDLINISDIHRLFKHIKQISINCCNNRTRPVSPISCFLI